MNIIDPLHLDSEENERRYGKHATRWEEMESLDDAVTANEKAVVDIIKKRIAGGLNHCPHLHIDGRYFYFCEARMRNLLSYDGMVKELFVISPNNPKYSAHVEAMVLQIYCANEESPENYKRCIEFPKEQVPKKD